MRLLSLLHRIFQPTDFYIHDITMPDAALIIRASTVQRSARCPQCGHRSRSIQSTYTRTLKDLPISGIPVQIKIQVRRFWCKRRDCSQHVFSQALDFLAKTYARTTLRQSHQVSDLSRFLGGRPTARTSNILGLATTRTTALRRLRAIPLPLPSATHAIGIDDFAFKKGHRYGTIVVDLHTHRPIDVLPDREAATVAAWLEEHPEIEVVSRDRSGAYANGISRGAPQARQIADRFHLLKNTLDALTRLLEKKHRLIAQVAAACVARRNDHTLESQKGRMQSDIADTKMPLTKAQQAKYARRERRTLMYEEVMALRRQGYGTRRIARKMNLARNTVLHWTRSDGFPEISPRARRSFLLEAWYGQIDDLLTQGILNAAQAWRELRKKGFHGSASTIRQYIRSRLNKQSHTPDRQAVIPRAWRSARAISWRLLGNQEQLDASDREFLQDLRARDIGLDTVVHLALRFMALVRKESKDNLRDWVNDAKGTEFHSFAQTIEQDLECVCAAIQEPWSQGAVEGNVNRLKTIKRQMYGRANFDLLRRRVLILA